MTCSTYSVNVNMSCSAMSVCLIQLPSECGVREGGWGCGGLLDRRPRCCEIGLRRGFLARQSPHKAGKKPSWACVHTVLAEFAACQRRKGLKASCHLSPLTRVNGRGKLSLGRVK